MTRRNYGRDSGVILDMCREHGIWFDAEELARILVWIRAGGQEKKRPEPKPEEPLMEPDQWFESREGLFDGLISFLFGPRHRW